MQKKELWYFQSHCACLILRFEIPPLRMNCQFHYARPCISFFEIVFLSLTLYFFLSDCISFFENVFLSSVLSITLCKALYFLWIVVHFREREKQLHLKSDIWAVSPSMHLQWTSMNIDDFSMIFSQASYDSEVRRFESIIRPAEQRITL